MSGYDVTLVSTYPPRGTRHGGASGVASYTANLAHALTSHGARVAVVAPQEAGEPDRSHDGAVRVERRFRRGPAALTAAAAAAADLGAPVNHLQHEVFLFGGAATVAGLVPALGRLRRRAGLVTTLHQVVDPGGVTSSFTRLHRVRVPAPVARTGLRALQGTVRRLSDRVVVHEPSFAGVVPGAVVIPHGVEERAAGDRAAARRRLDLDDDRLTALCFGFVAPYKGLETACEAVSLVDDRVELVVAGGDHPRLCGSDPYADRVRSRWGDTARFTGYVPDHEVTTWFTAADVALYPYAQPFSSSGAVALALAHGTPALLSPLLADTMEAPAALAASDDPRALAAQLCDVARRPEQRQRLGHAVSALAAGRSWPEVAARHVDLYEEVKTDAHRAPRRRLRTVQPG
ncbi:MAG: glycosyltransferase [Actinomycetota bacterium]